MRSPRSASEVAFARASACANASDTWAAANAAPAAAGGNVIEVLHTRHGQGLQISEVNLQVSVELRGTEHRDLVLHALREAGFRPELMPD